MGTGSKFIPVGVDTEPHWEPASPQEVNGLFGPWLIGNERLTTEELRRSSDEDHVGFKRHSDEGVSEWTDAQGPTE